MRMNIKNVTVEDVRQLLNENYKGKELKVKITYVICSSNADTSLLIENK